MSQAHVLCPSCNSEYPLPSGVQVNTATQCPKCGKTGVPMFLHEQTSSSSAAVLLVLAMLGGFLTLGVGIVVMVLIWLPSSMETPAPQERVLSRTVEQPPKTLEVETAPGAPLPERRVSPLPRIEPKKSTKALHKRDPALGELQYGWNQGQSRQYTFRIEAKTGDNKLRSSGSVIYTVTSTPEEMADSIPREEGSGSAFVVSANGHLVTCAHVAKGATGIEARLAGQRYPASIVAVDREHDLALLKIDARDLEPLPLGESQQVQLAQELRVVGFPLSDVLGESIKVSRGTVAGFVEQDEGRMLQIDAGINPGNSGGPLVDDRGRVIGVASAKLSGEAISNVGFAVPVDAVKRLLDANGVPSSKMESPAQSLKGPELARRVTPGVALLYVTTGPGGFDIDPRWSFRFSGSITTRTDDRMRYRPGQLGFRIPTMPRGPQLSYPKLDRGTVALDVYGRSVEADGEESLPFLLGSLGSMIFEPLGRPGQTRWQSHRTVSIHHIRKPERSGPPGFPRPPRMRIPSPFGPRFPFDDEPEEEDDVVAIQSAIEHVDYELTGNTDHEAVIRKRYRLKTVDNKDLSEDVPELNLTGEGEIRFDKLAGAPLSQEFNATLTIDEGDTTVRLPLTFSYRYFSSDDLAAAKKASSQAEQDTGTQVGSENSHEPTVPSEVPAKEPVEAPKDIADVLDAIEGSDLQRRRTALAALGDMEPDQHQDRVVGRLNDLLASEDSFTRITAARAMRRWANATALPALIEALDDDNLAVRHNAVEALAGLRAPEGASAIVERWRKLPGVGRSALQKMGIAAEPAVLQLLGSGDWSLRVDACRVLEAVGTQACIAALEQARQDEHRSVGSAAERALDRVQQRLAGKDQE